MLEWSKLSIYYLRRVWKGEGMKIFIHYKHKIYFISKNWKLLAKVFKIKKINNLSTEGFNPLKISKKHTLTIMSTKALYIWEHFVEIMINGKSFGKKSFELKK